MPAITDRLRMYLPGGGSLNIGGDDEVADIDKINENLQKIDAIVGLKSYPQASLPLDPFAGQTVEIEETGEIRYWHESSGTWKQLKPHVGTEPPANPQEGDLWADTR